MSTDLKFRIETTLRGDELRNPPLPISDPSLCFGADSLEATRTVGKAGKDGDFERL